MNLQDLGAVGEFAGAFLVAITLVFLLVQTRQNSKQLRLTNTQFSLHNYMAHIAGLFKDDGLRPVFRHGLADYENLTPEEKTCFHGIMLGFYSFWWAGFHQVRVGVISHDEQIGIQNDFIAVLKCPGALQWWEASSGSFGPGKRPVDELLQKSEEIPPITDVLTFLRLEANEMRS